MKLILTEEVPNLGAPGDIVEVKDGYGRNFLLPRGFAMSWTKGGDAGRLFGSITAADVALAVTKCGGPAVDKKAVELRGAVKTVGSHKASIKLHPGVTASVTFEVVAV